MSTTMEQAPAFKDVGPYNYTRPRQPIAAMFSSPGPCYGLPSLVGQKNHDTRSVHVKYPAWHFGIRHGKFRDDCSPGPCYFPSSKIYRDGKDGTPHYSLYSRNNDPTRFDVPGPGAYSPEQTGPNGKRMAAAYSFGTRHRARHTDQTPAANRYTLDNMLGPTIQSGKRQAPCISLRGRSKIGGFSEDLSKTPGPKYDVVNTAVYRNKPPIYSLTSRNTMPGDSTRKPGPGAHSPEKGTPKGIKMVYNYTIPRGPIAAMFASPGPCYGLPGLCGHIVQPHDPRSVHIKKPAYTFGLKTPLQNKSCSPGPKYKPHPKLYRDGFDGQPHYSMRQRLPIKPPFNAPGPAAYCPEKNFPSSKHPTAPHYSMRDRTRLRPLDQTPAPNTYTLPGVLGPTVEGSKKQAPIYSMRARSNIGSFSEDLAKAPGPGTYDSTDPSNYKVRNPIYTMAPRVFMPGDTTIKPGPGAHRPEDCIRKRQPPAFSFGIRHSPYTTLPLMEPPMDT